MARVGLIGLGLLGEAVARRLLAAGHAVVGHDVLPARVAALRALGGEGPGSIAAVTAAAECVCTILPSLATVEEAILGPGGVVESGRPGQTVIQISTISPALTRKLDGQVSARGLTFLDCPISGTSGQVTNGQGIFMVGGDRALYERWRPVLEAVLPRAFHVGAAGQAMFLKLVANLLIALHSAAAAEALALAGAGGLDVARALPVLAASAATSRMLEVRGPLMVRDEYPPQMKLDLFMKDLHLIKAAAAEAGARLPLTDVAERLYAAAHDAGHAGEDLAVVVKMLTAPEGGAQ